ncbi:hypothetical protein PF005_g9906 [Phytophthora fragariae]|nr:hypothetical protein PF003_g4653 [Phytophthora fragariae]KAE8939465.1 hypothetical protein PF009_g10680 [Phytophthora fragariae]KAE9012974.1 hypothetical protein PF011_g8670 [Phytophthora fragariae]KAE9115694.1 hypothetical protein PF010_g9237 [Phytophthora fragariae]KAE9145986.1 hypothetical protein PF006_g9197 [Phytophthora fragariae]
MSNCSVVTFMLKERNRGGGEAVQHIIQAETF